MMAARWRCLTVLLVVFPCITACDPGDKGSGGHPSSPQPAVQPIVDQPPYLCDLLPESEMRRILGVAGPLVPRWSGQPPNERWCSANAGARSAVGLKISYVGGEKVLREAEKSYADNSPRTLPRELGRGLATPAAPAPHPNYVISLFRCGSEHPWMRISFVRVVRGRDAVSDMLALMRIAQRRFGHLHRCTPEPN
jgi:hypothetical protein